MGLLLLFFALSIVFSFLCSIWEAVLLSITPSYINIKKQEGSKLGLQMEHMKEDIDQPLSAILTLNTIAHTVGAIGVGAQAGALFGERYFHIGPFSLSFESVIAALMTLAILVLSEIIPKTIGASFWKRLAPFTIRSLNLLVIILWPFVWLSQQITGLVKNDEKQSVLQRADLAAMTQAGEEYGILAKSESNIIKNLLRFQNIKVQDIMTPRIVIHLANENMSIQAYYASQQKMPFSRVPIYEKHTDHISGFVLKDDVLASIIEGKGNDPLSNLRKPIFEVKQMTTLPALFETLISQQQHLAIVTDKYGSLVGLVTMEDIFETLLGREIVDESDDVTDMQELARKRLEERKKDK